MSITPTLPSFPHASISRDERGIYTLQIADAKSGNILGTPVIEGLTRAAGWLAEQADARAVILRGTGDKAFVAGANIHEMAALTPESAKKFISGLGNLCEAVRRIPVPTIARISGYCLGGGMELAAACDIRLGSHTAVLGMPEVRIGIPSVIHAVLLGALIGQGRTNWLLLTGENISAQQALDWGYLEFVAEPGQLDALVERTAHAIVSNGPKSVRAQKQLLRYWENATIEQSVAHSVDIFGQAFDTDEPNRYMAPFVARARH